jgi:CRP-like cAMP-binding protein
MKPKKVIKELKKQLRKESDNLALRLQLAAAYQEAGQVDDAVEQYCEVAYIYLDGGHLAQAKAVCETALGLAPKRPDVAALQGKVEQALHEDMKKSQIDHTAAQGQWVPSLAASERAGATPPVPATAARASRPAGKQGRAGIVSPRGLRSARRETPMLTERMERLPMPSHLSEPLLTPTPLPAPLAPHDADEDSMTGDSLERYKLPIVREPSGSIPRLSLPSGILPVNDLLLEVEDHDEPAPQSSAPSQAATRLARPPGSPLVDPPDEPSNPFDEPDDEDGDSGPGEALQPDEVDDIFAGALDEVDERVTVPHPMNARAGDARRQNTDTEREFELVHRRQGGGPDEGAWRDTENIVEERKARQRPQTPMRPPTSRPARLATPRPARLGRLGRSASAVTPEWEDEPTEHSQQHPDSMGPGSSTSGASGPEPYDNAPIAVDIDADLTLKLPQEALRDVYVGSPGPQAAPPDLVPQHIHDDMELGQLFSTAGADVGGVELHGPLSVFARFPPEALDDLAARMALRHYSRNQYIVREGEPGNACYALVSGVVSVLRRDLLIPGSEPVEVARLHDGQFFGDYALLANRYRQASARATEDCHVYEIPRRLLRELAATYPQVGPLLDRAYRERLLDSLFDTCPFLQDLPRARCEMLRERFQPMRCESGERIIEENHFAGGLYLVVAGSIEVTKQVSAKRSVFLASLHEGAYVGDMAMWQDEMARATVSAAGLAELIVLPADEFYAVIEGQPELWARMRQLRRRRELENNQLITGETTLV